MKLNKNVSSRIVALAIVKSGSDCFYNGKLMHKVRAKTLMDKKGKVIILPDNTQVKVKV